MTDPRLWVLVLAILGAGTMSRWGLESVVDRAAANIRAEHRDILDDLRATRRATALNSSILTLPQPARERLTPWILTRKVDPEDCREIIAAVRRRTEIPRDQQLPFPKDCARHPGVEGP